MADNPEVRSTATASPAEHQETTPPLSQPPHSTISQANASNHEDNLQQQSILSSSSSPRHVTIADPTTGHNYSNGTSSQITSPQYIQYNHHHPHTPQYQYHHPHHNVSPPQHPLMQSYTPPPPSSNAATNESTSSSSPAGAGSGTMAFVRPSDLLRPRAVSRPVTASSAASSASGAADTKIAPTPTMPPPPPKPERAIDRDERAGLKAIRTFLRMRNCYEVLPLSFRLIEMDVGLTVKESLNILVQCGIVSAPLWDSQASTYAGLLTVNDYLNVVRYYNLHADKLKDVDNLLLSDLKEVERVLNVKAPETISTSPEAVLYDALRKQLVSRARRIPLVSYDSESARMMVVSVITQYRILKFISMNVGETDLLRKPLSMIKLGTYTNLVRCSMETIVLDVIDEMVTRNISSVPIVTTDGVLLNVFEAVDVIDILKTGDYGNLTWTIGKALTARQPNHPGIYTCSMEDGLDTILDTIRKSRVHRLTIVDENNVLKGVLSLSDILYYILVDGPE